MEEEPILSVVVSQDDYKLEQVRLTVNEFREVQYLHLRKYYMDYDGDYKPTKDGICFPITIMNIVGMFDGLVELLSESDVFHTILENTDSDIIKRTLEKINAERT